MTRQNTEQEWKKTHNEQMREYRKKYYETHREQIIKTAKKYRATHNTAEAQKDWRNRNSEYAKNYMRKKKIETFNIGEMVEVQKNENNLPIGTIGKVTFIDDKALDIALEINGEEWWFDVGEVKKGRKKVETEGEENGLKM